MRLARLIVPPAVLPVSLEEAKRQLSIALDETGHDELLSTLISAGTDAAQDRTGRQLVQATYRQTFDGFPAVLELPKPPLQAVKSITYRPTWDDEPVTLPPAAYRVEADRLFGRVVPVVGWPEAVEVVVEFDAGYPLQDGVPTTPDPIKHWIKVFVSTTFEHPEAFVPGRVITNVPNSFVDGLLDTYRVEVFV
jgi:uncharacterized phiE125 gp8 family phage protein